MSKTRLLVALLIGCTVLFCGLRLVRLDQKLYWVDEAATSEHITVDVDERISSELTSGDLEDTKQIASVIERSGIATLRGTIANLVATDPHHSPPFYLLLNLWSRVFGLEPGRLRLLSALFSLAAVPALYWLAVELFHSHVIAMISIWICALSPFHLIYAQQAREYSMWSLLILLSTASLARATRRFRITTWLVYFLLCCVMLWTHLLSIWVLAAHAAFVVAHFRKEKKVLIAFGTSAVLSLVIFAPWLVMIVTRPRELNDFGGIEQKISLPLYAETFILNFSRTVLDVGLPSYEHLPYLQWYLIAPITATVALFAYCVWTFMRRSPSGSRTLLGFLFISTMLPLVLADVVAGGRRALLPRYDSPTWISLELICAFSLWTLLSSRRKWGVWAGGAAMLVVLCSGAYSQFQFFSRTTWWTSRPPDLAQAAVFLAGNPKLPLAIDASSFEPQEIISLAYFLGHRQITAIRNQSLSELRDREIVVYRPSDQLIKKIKESRSFSTHEQGCLLRISRTRL